MKKPPLLSIDRTLAGKWYKQLLIPIITCVLVLLVISAFYFFNRKGPWGEKVAQAFVDMTNPETMRDSIYYTPYTNYEVDQGTNLISNPKKPNFWTVWGFVLSYIFGTIVFTGLLIATITSIWRSRADRFRRGAVKYRFSGHIVILGYNGLIPGMIQRICEEKKKQH